VIEQDLSPNERLAHALKIILGILNKYQHGGQAHIIELILAEMKDGTGQLAHLSGVEMWGGSGAV
jgi:hypothetical protein